MWDIIKRLVSFGDFFKRKATGVKRVIKEKDMVLSVFNRGYEVFNYTDAPFTGLRINAISCNQCCYGCQNEHLRHSTMHRTEIYDIISEALKSGGIIFGGLEWSERPREFLSLLQVAMDVHLAIIVYTGKSQTEFLHEFPQLRGTGILLKSGRYIKDYPSTVDPHTGIRLASCNQKVVTL